MLAALAARLAGALRIIGEIAGAATLPTMLAVLLAVGAAALAVLLAAMAVLAALPAGFTSALVIFGEVAGAATMLLFTICHEVSPVWIVAPCPLPTTEQQACSDQDSLFSADAETGRSAIRPDYSACIMMSASEV
jgi:hypothetical protein